MSSGEPSSEVKIIVYIISTQYLSGLISSETLKKMSMFNLSTLGAFHLTGITGFAGVAFAAVRWNARRRRSIVATLSIIAD